jgi:hypothetical protein
MLDAKAAYAKDLVEHRATSVNQREAEVAAAMADLEAVKVARLEAEGQAAGLDRARFDRAAAKSRQRAAALAAKTEGKQASEEQRRVTWEIMRKDLARSDSEASPIDVPAPPTLLE